MKGMRTLLFAIVMSIALPMLAQTRGVAADAIPGDGVMCYYRLALPVTLTAYQNDFQSDYGNVLRFWRGCEEFANRLFVPLGVCFDVVEDNRLVMTEYNLIDDNAYNATAFGTELTNAAVGVTGYDVGLWVHYRDGGEENSGLSAGNGAYNILTKGSGYAKADKWVVVHELGHMFGADSHTSQGEGSIMDNEGEYFSYPSIKLIRKALVADAARSAYVSKLVSNTAPVFDDSVMKEEYSIPQGACMAIPVQAIDENPVAFSAIGCSSTSVGDINGEWGVLPHFRSLPPQSGNTIDYRPQYKADSYYDDCYYIIEGTDIPSMSAGLYSIAFLVNNMPASMDYEYLLDNPFYSYYAVWDAVVRVVGGTPFKASISPAKDTYSAGEEIAVSWGVNSNYFTKDSRLRITMSTNYGKTFDYTLAESVPVLDGSCEVVLPEVNVGSIDVDFVTAIRSMRGGIIRVEEIGGVAYTLTTLTPENGGGFTVVGGVTATVEELKDESAGLKIIYDLQGRRIDKIILPGVYIVNGKKMIVK